jgi:hypothetical protein
MLEHVFDLEVNANHRQFEAQREAARVRLADGARATRGGTPLSGPPPDRRTTWLSALIDRGASLPRLIVGNRLSFLPGRPTP